jgi:hypothetical protein
MFALAANIAMAQATSAVRGTIADQQGGVLPNATVTLTSKDTGQTRSQKTTPSGNFAFDLIPPGHYMLIIDASGFRKTEIPVEALIARPSDLGVIKLTVGAAGESITVSAENQAVQVNTQDSSLGANFIASQITQLPVEARNVLALLSLQAGVTSSGYVAGARSDQSNITLDGININDAQTNSIGSAFNAAVAANGPVLRLNGEAVEAFRVATVSASASGGRSSGAQINLVTKSGTNQWHGSAFEYHRNTIFSANDWFNNNSGIKRPKLIRNTFGGMLSGPIKTDKLFFMYSYEGRRDASQIAAPANYVPLPTLGQGIVNFLGSDGAKHQLTPADIATIFPDTGGENPAAVAALAAAATKYPANDYTFGDSSASAQYNVAAIRFNAAAPVKLNSHVARLDYNLSLTQQVFLRANVIHDHDNSGAANAPALPDGKHPGIWSHPWGMVASHTWTVRSNLINNFRYGYTRESFTQAGDSSANNDRFRFVFLPVNGIYDSSRRTPVHNFVDDLSWVKGNHTFTFGANITAMTNTTNRLGAAYDNAITNPSFYNTNLIINSVNAYLSANRGYTVANSFSSNAENAITALLGRYSQFTASFTYGHDLQLKPVGTPSHRDFATQGYDGYAQDTWKLKPTLTVTYGIRYSLWRPVYEKNGFEVQPTIPLSTYFYRRVAAANAGTSYTDPIVINLSGPVNGGPPLYNWDKTVFLPKGAVAWSPRFEKGFWSKLFGENGQSVLRGGFAVTNDYIGPAIATFFDQANQLGFNAKYTTGANTFNVGCGQWVVAGNASRYASGCTPNVGPLFTSYTGDVRSFPGVVLQQNLVFPQQKPFKKYPGLIESSLDSVMQTPRNYVWSFTYERELPKGGLIQLSYLGRLGRHLLAQRDVGHQMDLVDPKSRMDWYTAATILEKARQAGTNISQFQANPIPYFENEFATLAASWGYPNATMAVYDDACAWSNTKNTCTGGNANDWTTTMQDIEPYWTFGVPGNSHPFYQPQYGDYNSWTTIGNSTYHALAVSFRQRLKDVTLDVNYTYSHSLDDASGLQSAGGFSSSALVLNPLRQHDMYASSDFDMKHIVNVSSVVQLPFGRGKLFAGSANGVEDAIIGGWQLSNIFRWNTGLPLGTPIDSNTWATNYENQAETTMINSVPISGCVSRGGKGVVPNFFGACNITQMYQSFRNAYPGETGGRNVLRYPGYIDMDMGLGKTWKMPYKEGHELQFRAEVFNISNTQHFTGVGGRSGWGVLPSQIGANKIPASVFANLQSIQGTPRVMQFGLRYSF